MSDQRISQHHSFDVYIAAEYGIECAILIHHFAHWININARLGKNFHENKTWVYQSHEDIAANYPYLSYDQVRRYIKQLLEKGVLIKGNFNKNKFDQTIWYSFTSEFSSRMWRNCQMEAAKQRNGSGESASCNIDIYTKTDTKKDIYANESQNDDSKNDCQSQHKIDCQPKLTKSSQKNKSNLTEGTERAPLVFLSENHHEKWMKKQGDSRGQRGYEILSEWKQSKAEVDPKVLNKHTDYYRLTHWVSKQLDEEDKNKPAFLSQDDVVIVEKRRAIVKSHIRENFKIFQTKDVCFEDRIAFVEIGKRRIKYNDPNFKDLYIKELEKYGVNVKGGNK